MRLQPPHRGPTAPLSAGSFAPTAAFLSALVLFGVVGCSAPEGRSGRLQRLNATVVMATKAGPLTVRYNPANCECPPYEIWVQGRWIRLQLTIPSPTEDPALLFAAPQGSDVAPASLSLVLSLDSNKPKFCTNGTVFYTASVVPPEPLSPE